MKNTRFVMTVLMVAMGAVSAMATSPIQRMPTKTAQLRPVVGNTNGRENGTVLTLWAKIGPRFELTAESLVLLGRNKVTEFRIEKTLEILNGSKKIEAVDTRDGNKLTLIDHTGNVNLPVVYTWNVIVTRANGQEERFVGNPNNGVRSLPAPQGGAAAVELGLEHLDDSLEPQSLELRRGGEVEESDTTLTSAVMPRRLIDDKHATLVEKRGGFEVNAHLKKSLSRQRPLNAAKPVAFSFFEEKQVYCITAPCPAVPVTRNFTIVTVENIGCGSFRYTARETGAGGATLEVVDHSTRLCEDYRPYLWEVKLHTDGQTREPVRMLYGNPKTVELGLSHLD